MRNPVSLLLAPGAVGRIEASAPRPSIGKLLRGGSSAGRRLQSGYNVLINTGTVYLDGRTNIVSGGPNPALVVRGQDTHLITQGGIVQGNGDGLYIEGNATATVCDGSISADLYNGVWVRDEGTTLQVVKGSISSKDGIVVKGGSRVTIAGNSTIIGTESGSGLYLSPESTAEIYSGTIGDENTQVSMVVWGTAEVYGGTFNSRWSVLYKGIVNVHGTSLNLASGTLTGVLCDGTDIDVVVSGMGDQVNLKDDCSDIPAPPCYEECLDNSGNLALNPSFENGLSCWSPEGEGSPTIQIETNEAYSGSQSVLCKDRVKFWQGVKQNMNGRLELGKTYHVSCWAKLKNAESEQVNLVIATKSDNKSLYRLVSGGVNNSTWTKVEGDITVAIHNQGNGILDNVYMKAECLNEDAEYWVDDVSVVLAE